ncbi:hypothetical protein QKT49_gp166 [Acanthamoeba castellanii medusavirus]|uniref:Uncharacterized protein n=1 Tax=Acanthamoeba castellanii medusavirus J1 TaxID=3114988 RepID=A0A3T1CXL9_9VIRU|nr:hypothetical protein QKT49_gp166 [Acanthamoeba castellanii medusavirus]BBI30597.1 hypothetical protein [Acanthamoeba castellanii medusavirus J1]
MEEFATHEEIGKKLFVVGGGIAWTGGSKANGWVPEVTIYEGYPRREELEAHLLNIDPKTVITYTEGTHKTL